MYFFSFFSAQYKMKEKYSIWTKSELLLFFLAETCPPNPSPKREHLRRHKTVCLTWNNIFQLQKRKAEEMKGQIQETSREERGLLTFSFPYGQVEDSQLGWWGPRFNSLFYLQGFKLISCENALDTQPQDNLT